MIYLKMHLLDCWSPKRRSNSLLARWTCYLFVFLQNINCAFLFVWQCCLVFWRRQSRLDVVTKIILDGLTLT